MGFRGRNEVPANDGSRSPTTPTLHPRKTIVSLVSSERRLVLSLSWSSRDDPSWEMYRDGNTGPGTRGTEVRPEVPSWDEEGPGRSGRGRRGSVGTGVLRSLYVSRRGLVGGESLLLSVPVIPLRVKLIFPSFIFNFGVT